MPTTAKPAQQVQQKITIKMSEQLVDSYEERAIKLGKSVEAEIVDRLVRCQSHTSQTGLYLTDDQRSRLSVLFGKLVQTPEDLIKQVEQAAIIKVAGCEISLDAQLLTRLEGRRFGRSLDECIRQQVVEGLQRYTGLI